jgi:hypothetical protein
MIASSRPHCALCPKTATAQITLLRCFERNYRDRYANAVVACNASRGRLLPGFGPFEIVSTHDNKCAGSSARLRSNAWSSSAVQPTVCASTICSLSNLDSACNSVQGATASLASTAFVALLNL